LGFQIQLDPFDKKQEDIEMLIYLQHRKAEVTTEYTSSGKTTTSTEYKLDFFYQKLEMQTDTGKSYELHSS
jgi:hypothetical protein